MSNQILGVNSNLLLGLTSGNKVNFTGVASGAESIEEAWSQDSSDVAGGRGVIASQPGRFLDLQFTHGCRSNAALDAVMREAFGARLYGTWASQGGASGSPSNLFEAVAQPTLTFGYQSNVVSWTNTLYVDGNPVVEPLSSAIVRPTEAVSSFLTSQCDFYFGTTSQIATLNGALRGDVSLASSTTVVRDRANITAGVDNMTADGIGVGFTVSATLVLTTESRSLLSLSEGIFVVHRRDANYAYGIPCWIQARPLSSPCLLYTSDAADE